MPRPTLGRTVWVALVALLVAAIGFPFPAPAQEVRYVYDALNRLVAVVDPQGNAAEYVYDAVGNLRSIRRFTATVSGPVAILLVRPIQGTAHMTVEIDGWGFSPVPAENQVRFNGTLAPVTAATETTLLTTVPASATTGPLTVTTPLGSATAPDPFTVLGDFVLAPDQADVALGATLGFQARLNGTPTTAVTWRVNGTVGGSALFGTITTGGVYQAPATPPPVPTVTVEAVRTADPTWIAPATVRLTAMGGTLGARAVSIGRVVDPAALSAARPVSVRAATASGGLVSGGRISIAPVPLSPPVVGKPVAITRGPAVLTVAPATGPVGATNLAVTLTGGNFQGATAVRFLRNGSVDPTLTATGVTPAGNGASLTCTLTIGGSAPTGARVVQVVTPQGTSTAFDVSVNRFTVTTP
jgi:YD repeat-containing protein